VDSLTAADASPGPNLPVTGGVHFAVGGSWIDGRGQDVIADGASWLVLTDEAGAPSIRLAVARPSDRDAWLAALTPASRLALTNARLAAVVHARVREVAASQRRIVVAADGERRRIERDLHDGAQQQLVSIALHLSAVRNRLQREPASELAAELNAALDSVNVALAGLRRLAHGIFPPALGDEGLAAALEDAVTGSGAVVDLTVELATEPDLGAAMAAYATSTLALELAGTDTTVQIRVGQRGTRMFVNWTAIPVTPPTEDVVEAVQDRVGALGGTLSIRSLEGHALELEAVIPCESS
jgi:signal transduction histidine kinase